MNRDIEEQLIIRYGYFAGRMRNVYDRYPHLIHPDFDQDIRDLSVGRVAKIVMNDTTVSNVLLQAAIIDDIREQPKRKGVEIRSATLDSLMVFVGQGAPAVVNAIKDSILASGGIEAGDAEEVATLVEMVDNAVTKHGNRMRENRIWGYYGGSTGIPAATFWEEKKGATTPIEERMVTHEKLCSTKAQDSYLCVIQDDSTTLFANEPSAALVLSDGYWRPDPTEGAYKECFALDVGLMLGKGYYNVITGVARDGDTEKYFESIAMFPHFNSSALTDLFRSVFQIAASLANLTEHAVNKGYASREEEWVRAILGEIQEALRPLTAEDNPDAKFDIGGWS